MLVPECVQALVQRFHFGALLGVVALGQLVVELGPMLAQLVDLPMNFFQSPHAFFNVRHRHAYSHGPRKNHTRTAAPTSAEATARTFRNVTMNALVVAELGEPVFV